MLVVLLVRAAGGVTAAITCVIIFVHCCRKLKRLRMFHFQME
jgi:hypothetical protein